MCVCVCVCVCLCVCVAYVEYNADVFCGAHSRGVQVRTSTLNPIMRMSSMARSRGVQVRDLNPKPCVAVCACVCEFAREVNIPTMSKAVGARAVGETWYREVLKTWYREVLIPTQCIHMFTDWSRARAQTSTVSQMLTSEILP